MSTPTTPQVSVLGLRALTPISFIYIIGATYYVVWFQRELPLICLIFACYALAECLFFLGLYLPLKHRTQKVRNS